MPLIHTTRGELDESTLRKTEGGVDTETETTTWVEYCLRDCDGAAHRTGAPAAPGVFCDHHIHRSVCMTLKKSVFGVGAVASVG